MQKQRVRHVKTAQKQEATRRRHALKRMTSRERREYEERQHASDDDEEDRTSGLQGVWDLRGERPPPSSIAARKDTVRAFALHLCVTGAD